MRRILVGKPDVFLPVYALVSLALGGIASVGASALFLGGLAPMCKVLPLFAASSALGAPLFWSLRHTRFDRRGRFRRLAIEFVVFSILMLAVTLWWRMHPESC